MLSGVFYIVGAGVEAFVLHPWSAFASTVITLLFLYFLREFVERKLFKRKSLVQDVSSLDANPFLILSNRVMLVFLFVIVESLFLSRWGLYDTQIVIGGGLDSFFWDKALYLYALLAIVDIDNILNAMGANHAFRYFYSALLFVLFLYVSYLGIKIGVDLSSNRFLGELSGVVVVGVGISSLAILYKRFIKFMIAKYPKFEP